ncbi:hypothetical protein B0H11DRAFT_1922264 [Mycena galericulata]|nr:hypothetical protein B0H11DRAFT_1922264 [Mycena galericulata]
MLQLPSTSGLLTSRAPENSQQSAEHAEPLARTITPAFFSHIARVYSAHSDSASTEPGGLQESVVAGVGSNDVLAPEDPQESAEHAEPLARTVTPVLFFLAVEKESMAIASMVNKVETDVKSRHAPVNSSRSTRELAREHAEDAPPVASAAALPELDNAHFAYGSMAVEPAAAEAFLRGEHDADTCADVDEPGVENGGLKESEKSAQSSTNSPSKGVCTMRTFTGIGEDSGVTNPQVTGDACTAVDLSAAVRPDRGDRNVDTSDVVDDPGVGSEGVANEAVARMESVNEKGQDLHEGYARTSEAASDSSKLSLPARILTRTYLSNVERTRVERKRLEGSRRLPCMDRGSRARSRNSAMPLGTRRRRLGRSFRSEGRGAGHFAS